MFVFKLLDSDTTSNRRFPPIIFAVLTAFIVSLTTTLATIFFFLDTGIQTGEFSPQNRSIVIDLVLSVVAVFLAAVGISIAIGIAMLGFYNLNLMQDVENKVLRMAEKQTNNLINTYLDEHLTSRVELLQKSNMPKLITAFIKKRECQDLLADLAVRGYFNMPISVAMRHQTSGFDAEIEEEET